MPAHLFATDCPLLMAIVGAASARSAAPAIQGGADLVQIRAKDLGSRDLAALTRGVIAELGVPERVIVNGRPDVAEISQAAGVHLPESGLDVGCVRRAFPRLLIGVSRHDRSGLERAQAEGADYVLLGPVFETPGKEDRQLGLDRVHNLLEGLSIPVILIGGVTEKNAGALVSRGARGVAAIRPFSRPAEAAAAALALRNSFRTI